ncbi:MAG TPA: MFS transporter [Gaiellaceae bacterium]|nr:MFS transporter [Gaiellaceae bacterium]
MSRAVRALAGLVAVFRNENLRRLELAWGAAITAEWAHFVALGVFAYDTGGAVGVGVAGLVRMLPAALVAPFAASLGDRFRRERFLVAIALVGAAALAGSAVAFFVAENAPAIFALAAVVGLSSTLVRPAQQALLPSLARTPDELIGSNGASSLIESVGTLVGPLVAGVLVSVADAGVVFAVGTAALLAAAALFARVRVAGRLHVAVADISGDARRLLLAGLSFVLRAPAPRMVVGLIGAQAFVRGCLNVLIVVTAFRVLDSNAGAVGYMTAALGVGGLIGALGALRLPGRRLAFAFGIALVFWGLPIALIAPSPFLASAVLLLAVVGAANSVEDVAAFTLLQRIVPDDVLTRVLGVVWGLAMGGVALGSIIAPAVVAAVGPRAALVAAGSILPVLTLLAWRRLAEIDRKAPGPAAELALVDSVPMLAPLSLAAKEHLAAALVPVSVAAGDVVIREGDVGDRFYIVSDGELEVVAGSVHVPARAGDHFGEIALLRDVPRTASVHAVVDSQLYALERSDFLAAVTGHSDVRIAGETIAAERLARGDARVVQAAGD